MRTARAPSTCSLEVVDLKWEAKDATTATVTAEDESHDLKLKDDKLVLEVDGDKFIFTKSDKDLSGTVKKDRENAEKEEEIDEAVEDDDVQSIEISPAVTVADDDLCTITITEKFKDDWGDIGFVVNITNKSDKDLTFYAPSGKTNVNGTMKDPRFSAHLMPGTNATEEFTFSNGELDSLDDLGQHDHRHRRLSDRFLRGRRLLHRNYRVTARNISRGLADISAH